MQVKKLIRHYLLRDLPCLPKELTHQITSDPKFFQVFIFEEDNLIEDYLDGRLSKADRRRFVEYYLINEKRILNFEIIKFLRSCRRLSDETDL
jgi:hypothetical protein